MLLHFQLPLLRWKRFAVVAAMCIFAVRAVIVQIAFYLHIQTYVYRRPAVLSRPLIFATAFMSFFSVVIALFKGNLRLQKSKLLSQLAGLDSILETRELTEEEIVKKVTAFMEYEESRKP
ncbi:hypothetical protein MTR67_030482 [Solanum verrucosum]|uniref:Uncharacterized protein n=1 Tax=Solanum verrucosum TaxID=315347 RepID=A0AAF0RB28_SOLVR|nr:hypothetical protein MTR67_030482 [Solanum verrucosum]